MSVYPIALLFARVCVYDCLFVRQSFSCLTESPFGTTAALWTMYSMLRETREAENAGKKHEQGEGEEGENKGEHPEQGEDKGEHAKEGDKSEQPEQGGDKGEQTEQDTDAFPKDDSAQYAVVITEAVDNIKDCLALKRESDSQDENVKIFSIGKTARVFAIHVSQYQPFLFATISCVTISAMCVSHIRLYPRDLHLVTLTL